MVQSPRDRLIRYATSLSVLAAFSTLSFPVVLPFMLGSTALVLAILSKGGSERFTSKGKRAAMIAAVTIAVNAALFIASVFYFFKILRDPALQEQFSALLYKTSGITYEEFMNRYSVIFTGRP